MTAIDISMEALHLANRNIEKHGVADRIDLVNSDWFDSLLPGSGFDLIVSNPPYVATKIRGNLQPELDFEPELALYAGEDGMEAYRQLVPGCREHLNPGGHFVFEIGADQAEMIKNVFAGSPGLELLEISRDLSGLSRVAVARAVD